MRTIGKSSSVSPAKLAANRRNSKHSTGPKTQAGKTWSRRNAVKHGILSSALLVTDGARPEDNVAFNALLSNLRRDHLPVGTEENLLVEQIAAGWWRLRRALESEAGLLKRNSLSDGPQSGALAEYFLGRKLPIPGLSDIAEQDERIPLALGADIDRILRYETTVQRQLVVARNQLERLQRSRKGETSPATLNV